MPVWYRIHQVDLTTRCHWIYQPPLWGSPTKFSPSTETEVKVAYQTLSRIYHPDKNYPSRTGMTNEEASEHFKLINNGNQYLWEVL